jgi:hypothetical protein
MYTYFLALFSETRACYAPALSALGAFSGMLGTAAYLRSPLSRMSAKRALGATAPLRVLATLAVWPLLAAAGASQQRQWYLACAYTVVSGVLSEMAFLPASVLAAEASPFATRALAYSLYVAFIDTGDVASDWIVAPLIQRLHVSVDDWSGLPALLAVGAVSQLAVIGAFWRALADGAPGGRRLPGGADRGGDRGADE